MLQQTAEAKMSSQEVFWSAKFKSLMQEHEEEMGKVRAEVDLMRTSAESARNELEQEMLARHHVRMLTLTSCFYPLSLASFKKNPAPVI